MHENKKILYIINGASGAIGNALLSELATQEDFIVYGLSRKCPTPEFFGETLPPVTLVTSLGDDITSQKSIHNFVSRIPFNSFSKIVYIHAVGEYPFELNQNGEISIIGDNDGDGIKDSCMDLTFTAFKNMTTTLISQTEGDLSAMLFGGLADKHQPAVHQSWWKTIEKTKDYMKRTSSKKHTFGVLNISSVLCFHELLTRPYVFSKTNAIPYAWLKPHEIAKEVQVRTLKEEGYWEKDLFKSAEYYFNDYFKDSNFTKRKRAELGL